MHVVDLIRLSSSALTQHPGRSLLSALGIAVGVAAVILLTALGEGLHQFVLHEYTQFGTNLISISPGKSKTHGGSVGMFGSVRPLSLEDAAALRHAPMIIASNPSMQGNAEIEGPARSRRVTLYGVGADFTRSASNWPCVHSAPGTSSISSA